MSVAQGYKANSFWFLVLLAVLAIGAALVGWLGGALWLAGYGAFAVWLVVMVVRGSF